MILANGDHVRKVDDVEGHEGVGLVYRASDDGSAVWVEMVCNRYRFYPAEMFVKTDEPLDPGVGEGIVL